MDRVPSYTYLSAEQWDEKISSADALASPCRLCPRRCGIDRLIGAQGFCHSGNAMVVSSIFPHHGEEPCLSGTGGSGTVFFSGCTLKCVFCQNHQISHGNEGRPYAPHELAEQMRWLQDQGCHNVNLVTPTHFLPWVLRAMRLAAEQGLTIPIVYNCSGYELPETIAVLRDIVDIWLPDMKYGDNGPAKRYSQAPDYVDINRAAIVAMFRQTGALVTTPEGIALRGMCVRHLVLPGNTAQSNSVCQFLASTFDPADITVSIMAQYRPLYQACAYAEINRTVTSKEYAAVTEAFRVAGFAGYFQKMEQLDESFVINFKARKHEPLTGD